MRLHRDGARRAEAGRGDDLRVGDVVLKTRSKDDPSMPLPDRYREGGADYDPAVGETNFTHIGTVTCMDPIEITHMTSPTAKKDKSIKGWPYSGKLPWVDYDPDPEPTPEPEPEPEYATVYAENGKPVKMRAEPSTGCSLYWIVPVGRIDGLKRRNMEPDRLGRAGRIHDEKVPAGGG